MKAKKYTAAILTVLIFGFTTVNGQRENRSESRVQREPTTVRKPHTKQTTVKQTHTRQQSESRVRQHPAQKQQMQRQVQRQPATPQVRRQPATQQVQRQAKNDQVAQLKRPKSISTSHHPRSDYRKPETKVYARHKSYDNKKYYSGHHYHHTRPVGRIKTHYHHDTYINHYNVLYYPAYHEIYWTRNMYRDYRRWYPNYRWRYDYGYRINTISVFDAKYNLGEVSMVYGRVYSTWHNRETDDYLLFFGGDFPNQQFTVVLPGRVARKFNWRPERYFPGEHLTVTGLITTYDGSPEIIVKNVRQVGIY